MVVVTTLVAVMLYLDRVCLSIVGEQIKSDQNISPDQYAWLLSSFFWAYALFQIPAGWLGDRYGARVVLSAYLFLWSACTGLMGVASGFAALLLLRLG
jgi:MFS family permease